MAEPETRPRTGEDPGDLRRTMGRFVTGVAVVTAQAHGQAHGMTVNSLTAVSLTPPIVLVSLTTDSRTAAAVIDSQRFALSVLSARQEQIARRFSGRGEDHFAGLPLSFCRHSVPIVPDALAHIECDVSQVVEAGDHIVVFGLVDAVCHRDGAPLVFKAGRFGDYTDRGHEAVLWTF